MFSKIHIYQRVILMGFAWLCLGTMPQQAFAAYKQISAGYEHSCGLKTDGSVTCWGSNDDGRSTPPTGSFVQLAAGGANTCGLKIDGSIVCWGSNYHGQSTPPSGSFTLLAAGTYHVCALKNNGSVVCWGYNSEGQATPPMNIFTQLAAHQVDTCGLKSDGSITCWGGGGLVPPSGSFVQLIVGFSYVCGLKSDGSIACSQNQSTPPVGNFTQISAGVGHVCGIKADNSVACWGKNTSNSVGELASPTGSFSQLEAGEYHTCGLKIDGSIICWGYNNRGQATPPVETTNCNAVTEIPVSECNSLLELYNSTNGANWTNKTGWNQTNTPCSWFGVTCSGGYVQKITFLYGNNLIGTLPNLNMPNLVELYLPMNKLSGNIPSFNSLPKLQNLDLGTNSLSGGISDFNLPNLSRLDLSFNQLSGSIPNFSKLPNLQFLFITANKLSGNIPDFSNLLNLEQLTIAGNELTGSIPNFSKLPNLQVLDLYSNQLSGGIPNFSNLSKLQTLWLSSNQLSGNIPNFDKLSNLMSINLYRNQLSGNIPNFSNLPNLQVLYLYLNQLTGIIPNFASFNLANLRDAYFSENCGLVAYDSNQETILNQKDPNWKTLNPNCLKYTVSLGKSGNGSGTITGGGNFVANTTVNLVATPDANSIFTGWSPSPCNSSFQMPANNLTCTATFTLKQFNLTLNKTGNGQISGGGSFTTGSTVNLSVIPDPGWNFNGWTPNPCNSSFLMPANDLTCTANFSQIVCNYNLNPTVANHSANAENGNFNLTVTNGCNWSASSNQSWVRITNPSGSGNATISYSVDANPNTTARSAIISINGQSFTVNQAAKTITLNPSIEISSNSLTFSQQIPSIDVMVIYTQAAANETPNISNEIKATIDQTNTAYRNSGINQRLNLVYAAQINYQEADNMGVDLNRLTATNDGFIDEIHGLRDTYKADLVSLWRKNSGNKCGIGWLLVENSAVFQSVGFNVVSRSCAVTNLSFAHELGHNMGAHHDSYIAKENGLHNYSHGYTYLNQINPSQSWRTIMAYVDECLVKGYGSCARIPYFSNPNIFYQNIPTGHSLANNAATLNESSTAVGSFRGGSQSKETQLLTISNKGSANLNVSNIFTDNNVSWLSITPTSLSITPNNSEQVQITVDYSLIPAGISNSGLTINSNDPAKPALSVTVNAQSTGQMDMMTVDSSKSNVYDALKQKLKLDVNVPNAARRSGVDSFRVSLKPVDLVEKPNTLVFELEEAQQLNANLEGKSTHYDVHSGIVNVPAVNVPDQIGMPQLFSAKLQWLSQRTDKLLFEVVDANAIPMIAVE